MNVLVTGHGLDPDALHAARRHVAYERLIVLTADPDADDLATLKRHESLARVPVDVHAVDAHDLHACLEVARRVLDDHRGDRVRVHVAGGPNLLASALLLAAFQVGAEAIYCTPRRLTRIPIARTVDLADRFSTTDRAALLAIPDVDGARPDDLAAPGVSPTTLKAALLRLRRAGLVRAQAGRVTLTDAGRYYRQHFTHADRSLEDRTIRG